jgi:hypothetical protein
MNPKVSSLNHLWKIELNSLYPPTSSGLGQQMAGPKHRCELRKGSGEEKVLLHLLINLKIFTMYVFWSEA